LTCIAGVLAAAVWGAGHVPFLQPQQGGAGTAPRNASLRPHPAHTLSSRPGQTERDNRAIPRSVGSTQLPIGSPTEEEEEKQTVERATSKVASQRDIDEAIRALAEDVAEHQRQNHDKLQSFLDRLARLQSAVDRVAGQNGSLLRSQLEVPVPGSEEPLRFVFIPAGDFSIGYSSAEIERLTKILHNPMAGHNTQPQVRIFVSPGFFILDREVTRGQYAAFIRGHRLATDGRGRNGLPPSAANTGNGTGTGPSDLKLPVTNVTWHEAREFCKWASEQSGYRLRLPTEIEWEYAARGSWPKIYPWPDDERFYAWAEEGDGGAARALQPAENLDRSWRGIWDMAGNVSEWCLDRYADGLYSRLKPGYVYSPTGNEFVDEYLRIDREDPYSKSYRGGSYKDRRGQCDVGGRRSLSGNERSPTIGFRPVLIL